MRGELLALADGARYVLAAPLAVAALLATCLLLATPRRALPLAGIALVIAVATMMRWLPVVDPARVVPCILVVLGLVLALDLRSRGAVVPLAAVLGGAAVGLAGGVQMASWAEIAGADAVVLALLLLASVAIARIPRAERLAPAAVVARRMVGAWIAAIGMLMLALAWRAAQGGGLGGA